MIKDAAFLKKMGRGGEGEGGDREQKKTKDSQKLSSNHHKQTL